MISRVYSLLRGDSRVAGILQAVARSACLTVSLEPPGGMDAQRACALGRKADRLRQASCKKLRRAVCRRAFALPGVAGAKCPVGAYCLAAPVYADGLPIAAITAGGFLPPLEASSSRYAAVRALLGLAASEIGLRASSMLVAARDIHFPVERAYEFMQTHASEKIAVSEIARHAGVGRQHLSREWRRCFGASVADSLARLRIDRARRLLLCHERVRHKVAEIAFETGFGSVSQFNRTFLKVAGVSPREFRRRNAKR